MKTKRKKIKLTADFETLAAEGSEKTYVWAWGICTIEESPKFHHGNTISEFFDYIFTNYNECDCYFHNLKFDGDFILNYLLNDENNYKCVKQHTKGEEKEIETIITNDLKWYMLKIYKNEKEYITIYDSLKILNFSVSEVAKAFHLKEQKGIIDYKKYRPEKYTMTPEEVEYLKNDVLIMAKALHSLFCEGFSKMTAAGEALKQYKEMLGGSKNFLNIFPELSAEIDGYCRASYKGAFVYVEETKKGKDIGRGAVVDNNSLYPYCYGGGDFLLPYGQPIFYNGKYVKDESYPLYIQRISCQFILKDGYLPTIQLKHTVGFSETEYLTDSHDEEVILTMTSVDFELFLEHYEVINLKYLDGYKFKASKTLFTKYVDKYLEQKIKSKKEGNDVLYLLAKLMLNSLYGKFGTSVIGGLKIPYKTSAGLRFEAEENPKPRKPIYVPLASFVTAWARYVTISNAQKLHNEDRFCYSDTDSLHFELYQGETAEEVMERCGIEKDAYKLGAWDLELLFVRAKYIRQKCYLEEGYDPVKKGGLFSKVTIAGLPHSLHKFVNFDNFGIGMNTENFDIQPGDKQKLRYKRIDGGVILVPAKFVIK